jgi:ketosteroid isomerase-like protein
MNLITTPITGSESAKKDANPYSALVEFYQAFNGHDLEQMASNWINSDESSMSNPLGGVRRGWNDIQQVYDRIFNGPAEVYVEFYDYTIHKSGVMFCAVGRERGHLRINGNEVNLAIRTSRFYRLECGAWKQVHHHGSIDEPALLAEYQTAVLGKRVST